MAEENLVEGIEADDVYVGNGAAREFPITFTFSNESEVAVFLNCQVIRRGYKVEDGNVVFTIAPADGDVVSILKIDLSGYIKEDEVVEVDEETGTDTNTNIYNQTSQEHIKINPVQTKVKYTGNGVVYEFPTIFAFFENDNVVVYLNGVIINGGYSVTGAGETDGGLVIFNTPPAEGDKIVILRKVVVERVTDFQEGGSFRAKNINDEFDHQTAFCQQIQEAIERCVKVEVTDEQTPEELLAEVYGKLDSATEVAQEAVEAAKGATEAVASAEKTLAEVNTYVDESKEEIDALIVKTTTEIDKTIENATEEIKSAAVAEAEKAIDAGVKVIEDKAIEATKGLDDAVNKSRIWAEGEQAEVKELGGELSSMGAADLAYAIANAPEDTPIDTSSLFALNIFKGEKGDKGDKGDAGKDGKDAEPFDAKGFLNLIYPVGSIYISTTSTCPIASYGVGTWEKVGTSLVTAVNSTASVKGDGKALGLTNGSEYVGLARNGDGTLTVVQTAYGEAVTTSTTNLSNAIKGKLGVTTDATKSGMVATVSSSSITVNIFRRTA